MSTEAKYITAIVLGVILLFVISARCSGSGGEYYHVPGIEVDVDKGGKHYKPAPEPHFGSGTTTRKR